MNEIPVGFTQNIALAGMVSFLLLGGVFWLLKYFFMKDAATTTARFDEFKADFKTVVDRLDAEIRAIDKRLQNVELEQVRSYVPRKEYDEAVGRLHQRFDSLTAAINKSVRTREE